MECQILQRPRARDTAWGWGDIELGQGHEGIDSFSLSLAWVSYDLGVFFSVIEAAVHFYHNGNIVPILWLPKPLAFVYPQYDTMVKCSECRVDNMSS